MTLRTVIAFVGLAGLSLAAGDVTSQELSSKNSTPTKLGVDVLFEKHLDLVRGKRIGLITNPTGVDAELNSIIERFREHPETDIAALYGPEHGVRGNAQAGEHVKFYFDERLGLPVFSLYGKWRQPPPEILTNITSAIRELDATNPAAHDTRAAIDVMLFDLQDVGARVYTYIGTMAHAMEACAEVGIPFVVLDRPNPINGVVMEGPILDYPEFSSFIGLYPIPLRHGMTAGELAQLFNETFLTRKADLTVVPMENWNRSQWFEETGLSWVIPSPNLPTVDSTVVYPGQVLLEGTNLSEGRGTTKPFELFGAPWIDGYVLARELNALNLPGVRFREAWFTPTFSKFKGERCGGCQVHVIDRTTYRPLATALSVLTVTREIYGEQLELREGFFDKVMGNSSVREAFTRGESVESIVADFGPGLEEFEKARAPFLIYP
jgi:uncharacterized protein YbbC (DUF1343 family)